MSPLDIQANYGNLDLVVKEVNKIHNLSEQVNYNGSMSLEKFSKEIFERIVETNESTEQQHIDDRKKEEEERRKGRRKGRRDRNGKYIGYDNTELLSRRHVVERYKGNFVNILK